MSPPAMSVHDPFQGASGQIPSCHSRSVRALLALFVCIAMFVVAIPAQAQEEAAPTMVDAQIAVDMSQDGDNSVEATYTVQDTDGLEDGVVEHLLVRQPGAEIGDISLGNGSSDEVEVSEGEGIFRAQVPVTGDPASYTLRYEVRTDQQTFAVPIAVPDVAVAEPADSDIQVETLFPEGERLTGEVFPTVSGREMRDGRQVLIQRVNNVPSRVVAQYGEGSVFGISTFTSAAAIAVFGVVLFFWYRRSFGGGSQ